MNSELRQRFFELHFGDEFEQTDYIKAIKEVIKKSNLNKLYKYRAGSPNDIKNLKKNVLIAAKPEKFNDIFEFNYKLELNRFIMDSKQYSYIEEKFTDIEKINIDAKENLDKKIKIYNICCLSENINSLLMWAHYANEHKGFTIEYDFNEVMKKNLFELQPVLYSNRVVEYGDENTNIEQLGRIICTKSLEWNYEEEWRIFKKLENDCEEIEMPSPTGIYLGDRTSTEIEKELKEYCEKKGIPLYRANKNQFEYKLDFKKI